MYILHLHGYKSICMSLYYFSHILKGLKAGDSISDLFGTIFVISFLIIQKEWFSWLKNRAGYYSNM